MAADKGFHVDGWEEVWEYEDPEKPGLWKIYDPAVWDVDLGKTKLTGYHWNNMWEEDDTPTTGYMMANAGYNVSINKKISYNYTVSPFGDRARLQQIKKLV